MSETKPEKRWVIGDLATDDVNEPFDGATMYIEKSAYDKAVQALKFYAQETKPDTTSVFAKSALEFGEHCATWGPLTDLGERARAALKSLGEL